ncbi:MAG: GNAT family N-acetyltransferase [Bryobacteraceae bacterium]|nr:GNAT family N-acetyltransferase [Bryobacteraceae bacterium]
MQTAMNDAELARRSILGFGEMLAALGRWGAGTGAEVRWPNALGARIDAAAGNHWFDAVVVPPDAVPPDDDPRLPYCVWSVAGAVSGRIENAGIATPCMAMTLEDPAPGLDADAPNFERPTLTVLGEINERAYGDPTGIFTSLVQEIRDQRVRTYGLRDGSVFVCVALTLTVGDDVGIHYVATEASHRRRGLASRLLLDMLAAAKSNGMRSATLLASPDGLSIYRGLGFRQVATLRGYVRP